MKLLIKNFIIITFLIVIFLLFCSSINKAINGNLINSYSKNYYVNNTSHETGSQNIVTGIYLDYRLYDSIFEASILLITGSGIIFISKNDNES